MSQYTMDARRVIFHAREAVNSTGGEEITPGHLALALLEGDVRASKAFAAKSIDPEALRLKIKALVGAGPQPTAPDVPLAADTARILARALDEARLRPGDKVKSEDILVATILEDTPVGHLLRTTALSIDELRATAARDVP